MAYPSAFAGSFFKNDVDGRDVFYLWGPVGKGRIVPSAADGMRLRRSLERLSLLLPVIVVGGLGLTHVLEPMGYVWLDLMVSIALSALGIGASVIYFGIWSRSRNWEIASVGRTFGESRHAFLDALGPSGVIQVSAGLGLFAFIGLHMIVVGDDIAFGAVYLLVGGLGAIRYLAMWRRGA